MCFFSNLKEKYSIFSSTFWVWRDHLFGEQVHSSEEIIPCRRIIQYLHNMCQSFTGVFLTHVATTVGTNSVIAFLPETSREDVMAVAKLSCPWATCLQRIDARKMPQRLLRGVTLVLLHLQEKGVFPLTQDLLPSASRHAEAWGPG